MNMNPNERTPLKANPGFTLIEVMIAIAVFSVGILAVASLQLVNTKNNTTANIMTQATMLARAQVEHLENSDIATSADLTPGTHADPNNPIDENGAAGGIYTRTWTVGAGTGPTSREIEVTVNWNRLGQNRSVRLTTITRGN
jgi:prepilin-type N-terminal cleavage/methylation domain-containing protein